MLNQQDIEFTLFKPENQAVNGERINNAIREGIFFHMGKVLTNLKIVLPCSQKYYKGPDLSTGRTK